MRSALRWLPCLVAAGAVAGCTVTSDSALLTTKKSGLALLTTKKSAPSTLTATKKPNEEVAVVAVGHQVPEIDGEDVDGKQFKLSNYRGKVVMLDFWGNW